MIAAEIAQLAIILAPIAQQIAVKGVELVMTFKQEMTEEDITKALELSKSANWPKLDFKKPGFGTQEQA